jgi:hypothetical protein
MRITSPLLSRCACVLLCVAGPPQWHLTSVYDPHMKVFVDDKQTKGKATKQKKSWW